MSNLDKTIAALKTEHESLRNLAEAIEELVQIEREEDAEQYHVLKMRSDELFHDAKLVLDAFDNYGMVNPTFENALNAMRKSVKDYADNNNTNSEPHILLYEARRESDGLIMCSSGSLKEVKDYLCREYNVKDYHDAPCYITVVHDYEAEYKYEQ